MSSTARTRGTDVWPADDHRPGRCACLAKVPCQFCAKGRHGQCRTAAKASPWWFGPRPATYLTTRRDGVCIAVVWEVGHDHRWVCECHRTGHGQNGAEAGLFAEVAS